ATIYPVYVLFFFTDSLPAGFTTLSLHDALPIYCVRVQHPGRRLLLRRGYRFDGRGRLRKGEHGNDHDCHLGRRPVRDGAVLQRRSEEHTSELQSQSNLVCRLLLEKKKYTFCTDS